jgi:hypothetical protein
MQHTQLAYLRLSSVNVLVALRDAGLQLRSSFSEHRENLHVRKEACIGVLSACTGDAYFEQKRSSATAHMSIVFPRALVSTMRDLYCVIYGVADMPL